MTPERARELAYQAWGAWMETDHDDHVADVIKQAILKACAEQKEADAKIAQRYYDEYGYPVGLVVKAIRSAE